MKTIIDQKNGAIIVTGGFRGRRVKGVAVCSPEDQFDTQFGVELAKKKFKLKKTEIKIRELEKRLSILNKLYDETAEQLGDLYYGAESRAWEIRDLVNSKYPGHYE